VTPGPLEGRLALARGSVDRAAERRGDRAWLERAWSDPATRVLRVGEGRTLVAGDRLLTVAPGDAPDGERFLLGVDASGVAWFASHEEAEPRAPLGSEAVAAGLREVGAALADDEAGLLVLAVALANWHDTHRHCPRCGAPTRVDQAGFVRRCDVDGSEHYPRTDPAVIVLVRDTGGERALLGSSARWGGRRYSTLAGFVEPGESAEAAVVREIAEESGVRVGDVTYLGSQPWPFPSSLMLGFTARALDPAAVPVADGVELTDVRWFGRDDVVRGVGTGDLLLPPPLSIARRLVEHWYGGALPDPPTGRSW
jgi:NAD+ diphosphatase